MIRLLLDPPRFECETATDAAALAKLLGIVVERIETARPSVARQALAIVTPPDEDETGRSIVAPRAAMKPTGKTKTCKTCGKAFPVVTRGDCASVYCLTHRPVPIPPKKPKPVTPAAGKLGATRKHADPVSCKQCGASVPEFEAINGECLQCAPLAARKRA